MSKLNDILTGYDQTKLRESHILIVYKKDVSFMFIANLKRSVFTVF